MTTMKSKKRHELTLDEAHERLEIDDSQLDWEVSVHSTIQDEIEEQYANAKGERDTLRNKLKTLEAKLSLKIRRRSNEKITDATLAKMVLVDVEYQELNEEYLKSCLNADLWEAKKNSYSSRGYMLTKACDREIAGLKITNTVKTKNAEDAAYRATRRRLNKQYEED